MTAIQTMIDHDLMVECDSTRKEITVTNADGNQHVHKCQGKPTVQDVETAVSQWLENLETEEDKGYCSACSGSGEGMHDGTRCYKCKGTGVSN